MTNYEHEFLREFEEKFRNIYVKTNQVYWDASINGSEEKWEEVTKYQLELINLFREKNYFEQIKKLYSNISDFDPLTQRHIKILYNEFLPNQYDLRKLEEITNLQNKIENVFATFRANLDGKLLSDNDVDNILKNELNSKILQQTWEASKQIGELIVDDLIKLVKLRNEQANFLGFKNYHEMSLILSELDPIEVSDLFAQLQKDTDEKYSIIKRRIDEDFSKRFKIPIEDLMPWHYQQRFFQEAPQIYLINFNKFYENKDLVKITRDYFFSIGLNVDDIIQKSDFFEKPGKNQHAFCISIDRSGDVRVLCNVKSNVDWMGTLLHEFGHAAYDKFINPNLPFILRDAAHIFITEAIAQLFGKFSVHPIWIKQIFNLEDESIEKFKDSAIAFTKMNQIIFARWVFVMYEFESALYDNPDQDLNSLWYDIHKKFLLLNKPQNRDKPDWTTKIHIATSPCYYHNYLLGEIFSSQINRYIHTNILYSNNIWNDVLINNPNIGQYLIERLFKYGSSLHWKEVIKIATDEELSTNYYKEQYLNENFRLQDIES